MEDEEEKLRQQQKQDRERATQLSKLMKYREEKLQRDQEMLQLEKQQKKKEKKYLQKIENKQKQHNEKLKKQLEDWQTKKNEEDNQKKEEEQNNQQKNNEDEKAKQQFYEEQKQKISDYKQELRRKNMETLQILKNTKSEKKLGVLKHLKDPKTIEKIDMTNEYHLPVIVRHVEMMENEKAICPRYLTKHSSSNHFHKNHPRSRRLTKRSPLTHRSRNGFEHTNENYLTQKRFASPQAEKEKQTRKIYLEKNVLLLTSNNNKHAKSPNSSKLRSSKQESVSNQEDGLKSDVTEVKPTVEYTEEKVADNFMSYNNQKKADSKPNKK